MSIQPHEHAHPEHDHSHDHEHEHDHEHGHAHFHPTIEAAFDPGRGSVLDIGGEVGALVLYAPADWNEREIDIHRPGDPRPLGHSQVHERTVADGSIRYAAVYPSIAAGYYLVRPLGTEPIAVAIRGAHVTEAHLTA